MASLSRDNLRLKLSQRKEKRMRFFIYLFIALLAWTISCEKSDDTEADDASVDVLPDAADDASGDVALDAAEDVVDASDDVAVDDSGADAQEE
jgi:hypothetical protein